VVYYWQESEVLIIVEKLIVDGREVVQIPLEDFMAMMEPIAAEKKRKDDLYRERIEMAEKCLEEGGPFVDIDEMFDRCKERAIKRRIGNAVNE